MDLVDNGSNVAVTGDNLEAYTEKLQHHWLKRRRIAADCVAKGYHEVLGDVGTTQLLELHHAHRLQLRLPVALRQLQRRVPAEGTRSAAA